MKYLIALAFIGCVFAPAFAQELSCYEEFFRVSRRENSCQDFFVCMLGGRVDFSCDQGHIFDEDSMRCRHGNADTCLFGSPEIPADACDNDFLSSNPHPDETQCMHFFVCLNFNMIPFRCEIGMIYSRETERCVYGSWDDCEEGGLTPFRKLMKAIGKQ